MSNSILLYCCETYISHGHWQIKGKDTPVCYPLQQVVYSKRTITLQGIPLKLTKDGIVFLLYVYCCNNPHKLFQETFISGKTPYHYNNPHIVAEICHLFFTSIFHVKLLFYCSKNVHTLCIDWICVRSRISFLSICFPIVTPMLFFKCKLKMS